MKKFAGDIIILHMSTKNHNHMMYGSWDLECNRQNCLPLWTVFCPFTPLWTQKIKILKNEKNTWRCYHFTNVYHKSQSCDIWTSRYRVQQTKFFLSFWTIFYLFTSRTTGKIKILKNWRYHHFTQVYQKLYRMLYYSLDMAPNGFNCYFSFWAIFYPFTSLTAQKIKI